MTPILRKGRYVARLAHGEADLRACQRLRYRCFVEQGGGADADVAEDREADRFDAICDHVMVEDGGGGGPVCCFRLMHLPGGARIGCSYSAQFYDLAALERFAGPMVEMGRFCIRPGLRDADVLRIAWGALTRIVDGAGAEFLFGCSSFAGTRAETYGDAFAMLGARHLAPAQWQPRIKAPEVVRFAGGGDTPDAKRALSRMPPLLRTYLAMGGWVSDHAVVDARMNTLHVFTGLEIGAIPPARARALRAVAS